MNLIQINNLRTIINVQYPHLCLNTGDLEQFLNIPWEKKKYYPMRSRGGWYDKKGFFHGGAVTIWANNLVKPNHLKIADKETPMMSFGKGWSDELSFEEEKGADIIQRIMKLKAFW